MNVTKNDLYKFKFNRKTYIFIEEDSDNKVHCYHLTPALYEALQTNEFDSVTLDYSYNGGDKEYLNWIHYKCLDNFTENLEFINEMKIQEIIRLSELANSVVDMISKDIPSKYKKECKTKYKELVSSIKLRFEFLKKNSVDTRILGQIRFKHLRPLEKKYREAGRSKHISK